MYRVFDLIGINSYMWEYNHNLSHHYVPNIPVYDSAIDSFGLFRFHPRQYITAFTSFNACTYFFFTPYQLFLISYFLIFFPLRGKDR